MNICKVNVLKSLNAVSRKQYHTIAQGLLVF